MSKKCFDEKIFTNKVIVKVSSTFSKVAGVKGAAPLVAVRNDKQSLSAKSPLCFKKTEQG